MSASPHRSMGPPAAPTGRCAALLDAALCAGAALLLYATLAQQTFYKIDGHLYLAYVLNGERSYPRHFLYLPLVFLARDAGAVFGCTLYESARALSAVGTAAGVGLLHLASRRLGLARGPAFLVTLLCATMPHVVFFATIVEVHGSFMPFLGLAACAAAALAAQPAWFRAGLLGVTCGLAFCAHSTGALLPALFLPLLLLYPRRPFRAGVLPGALTAAALATTIAAAPLLARAVGVDFDLRHSGEFATDRAGTNLLGLARYGRTLLTEWLLPMLPLSALLPFALFWPRVRVQAAWLALAAGIYLFVTLMILGGEAESGAYFLPFAWPLALLALRAIPPALLLAVAGLQSAAAVVQVKHHDDPARTLAYASGVRAAAGGADIALLAADDLDLQALFLHLPQAERIPLFELARLPVAAADEAVTTLARHLDDRLLRGKAVFLADAARARITAIPTVTPCGGALLHMLDATYAQAAIAHPGYTGHRLLRR